MEAKNSCYKKPLCHEPPIGGFFCTMKSIKVAIAVIINAEGLVLLTQRNAPTDPMVHLCWQLPGGGVEKNETTASACIREAYEETGLNIKLLTSSPFVIKNNYENTTYILNGFKASVISGTINTHKDIETNDAKWVDPKDISKLRTLKHTDTMVYACMK